MIIGMRGHDLGTLPLQEFVKKAKETGVTIIQLALGKSISGIDFTVGNFSHGLANYIGGALKENDIHVSVLGSYINPVTPVDKDREKEMKRFKENLKYAKYIGADMVGTETGNYNTRGRHDMGLTRTESCYQLLLQTMRELVAEAEKLGVMIGMEGVTVHTLYCPELMKRFLVDINSPNVCVIFDAANMIDETNYQRQNELFEDVFTLYGDKVAALHLKDFVIENGVKKNAPVGEGMLDFESLFRLVKKHKPYIHGMIEDGRPERFQKDCDFLYGIYNAI